MMILNNILTKDETKKFLNKIYNIKNTTFAIEIVESCNLACPGCWVGISRDNLTSKNIFISNKLLYEALKFGINIGIEKLSLLGGEPTLHPKITEIILFSKLLGYKTISITTNGVVSKTKMKSILSSGLTNINFSIDGSCSEIHDSIRPSINQNQSTFKTTIKNLELALQYSVDYNYSVQVNTTIFRKNFNDVENIINFLDNKGVKTIRFHFSMPNDLDNKNYILPHEWINLYKRVLLLNKKLQINLLIPQVYYKHKSIPNKACSPYLTLQPDGKLIYCATYARLFNIEKRYFAYLLNKNQIKLNNQTYFNKCDSCAIPQLVTEMEDSMSQNILKYNMHCIIVGQ